VRTVEPDDAFEIKGRGICYTLKAEPDPLFTVGEHVMMAGTEYCVRAIERFAVTPVPGRPCGLLLEPVAG
jgi:hypothetical protein